ncbi:pentatricopeptide repeat-containing protein 2, mitochondrial [Ptiloglossa arizonensis]|uniref:pentatricopeptide repeat-containing protein 2, mitochondrial n=1 Tax=Ptiloglossa arizonensis TaxID=3350558 RepID=UPI003F9FF034
MAIHIRGLCRLGVGLINNNLRKINLNGFRFMYTEQSLGLTQYENTRFIYYNQFATIEDTFRRKMNDICNSENGIVFTEDMKAMLHLAQRKESDYELLLKMIQKYINCKSDVRLGTYNFGPIVMRLFYFLNEPATALSTFKTPSLNEFFGQKSTYQILLCLLYKNNMFNEMREVYDHLVSDEKLMPISKYCFVIIAASCYKQGNPDATEYALKCWKNLIQHELEPSYKSSAITAAIALRNKDPNVALEILSSIKKQQYVDVRCLKILAYIESNKILSIIPLLKTSLDQDYHTAFKHTYYLDVIRVLENRIQNDDSPEATELKNLIFTLKKQDRVIDNVTLEEKLLKPIIMQKRLDKPVIGNQRFQMQSEQNNRLFSSEQDDRYFPSGQRMSY